jgi:adenylate kinase
MEEILTNGGCVVDFHTCGLFPERWFDLVLVLRADTNVLYDRLKKRGYSDRKVNENMECEIMQVVLEEARESYAEDVVKEIKSNSIEELESNVESIAGWAKRWALAKSSSSSSS